MSENLDITVVKSKRRTIALAIQDDGTIHIKAPLFTSQKHIDQFVSQHKVWIEKRLSIIKKSQDSKRKDGEYLFLGETIILNEGNFPTISLEKGKLLFPQGLTFRKEKELMQWYKAQAKEIITKQVEFYAKEMKTTYKEITFSDTRSQWGRCTHDNRLQFSWRLIMAPLLVVNYVVVHELSHTLEKNHTQMFWMKVRNFNPSYRQQIKWLKENGHTLKI